MPDSRLPLLVGFIAGAAFSAAGAYLRWRTKPRSLPASNPHAVRDAPAGLPLVQNAVHDMAKLIESLQFRLAEMERLPDDAENQWRALFESVNEDVKGIADYTLDLKLLWQLNGGNPTLRREEVDMHILSNEVLAHLAPTARHAGVQISCQSQPGLPPAYVDRHQMKRVLINLVDNAIHYAANQVDPWVLIRLSAGAGNMVVEVADNGIGIPPENLHKFWEESSKPRDARTIDISGSGLGTVIVRRVVEQHGGKVEVTSSAGLTTFRVVAPLTSPAGSSRFYEQS
jgi:signal transduction histidine kinase